MNNWSQKQYDSAVLHRYLSNAEGLPKRVMTEKETAIRKQLFDLSKRQNALIVELLTLKRMIVKIDPSLYGIAANFERVVNSVLKQRGLINSAAFAYAMLKPNAKEARALNALMIDVNTRRKYIEENVIGYNVELTPFKEYIDIIGHKWLIEDIRAYFPETKDLFTEKVDAYFEHVMQTVRDAGKEHDYKPRLEKYYKAEAARMAVKAAEKAEQRAKVVEDLHNASERLNYSFSARLTYCIERFIGDERIGIKRVTMGRKINEARGRYIVLATYIHGDRTMYRYLAKDGRLLPTFTSAMVFDREEAEEEARKIVASDGRKAALAFEVV